MKRLLPLVVVAVLCAGCATVTFRRGAGPGDMRADEDACRATSASEAAYAACLRERGWLVAGKAARTGKPAAMAAAGPAPAATTPAAPPAATQPAAAPPAPTKAAAPTTSVGVPPPANPPAATAGPAAKASASATTRPTASAPVVNAAPADTAPTEGAAPDDPLTRIEVSSWWKLGGTAAELDRAMATCADKLGAAHKPGPGGTEVTIGMRDCLREAKWFPLGGTGGRP